MSTKGQLQDGPTLLYTILKGTFQPLSIPFYDPVFLHPCKFNYEITKVNKYIQLSLKAMHQNAPSGQALSNQKLLFYLFNAYKRIKAFLACTANFL